MTTATATSASTATTTALPAWAQEMGELFRSGSISQFILHGDIHDVVPAPAPGSPGSPGNSPPGLPPGGGEKTDKPRLLGLRQFLDEVMFESYDVVLHYDRSRGVFPSKGGEDYAAWLQQVAGTDFRTLAQEREPSKALELIDRYLLRTLNLAAITAKNVPRKETQKAAPRPRNRIAVVIHYAEFVVPRGDPLYLGREFAVNIVKMLGWANDPAILNSNIATVLVTENLHDLSELVVENPHAAKLKVPLPGEAEMLAYLETLQAMELPDLAQQSEVTLPVLARRLTGLSRVGARMVLSRAIRNGRKITSAWLAAMKKESIERECQGLLEFVEYPFTLDHVAGNEAVKQWLREDTQLLRKGALHALPMGYLFTGRIGTGKTFIVQCWAGELGIPCVVFKNFRDRWVGATESNLDKIFSILRALGQVVVFVDEADQAAGKRESSDTDGGLSGRVYAMLAKEMSDTRNRGKIIWIFATSRPDLLEVDLKRQGRLDVHIPLFPPQTPEEMKAILKVIARKLKFPLSDEDMPDIPESFLLGGNEIEGALVRALRTYELASEPRPSLRDVLTQVVQEVRPSAHTRKLEYMDLVAVKECTDARFLPARYKDLSLEEIDQRIEQLRRFV